MSSIADEHFDKAMSFAEKYLENIIRPESKSRAVIKVRQDGTESKRIKRNVKVDVNKLAYEMHCARNVLTGSRDGELLTSETEGFIAAIDAHMLGHGYYMKSATYEQIDKRNKKTQ